MVSCDNALNEETREDIVRFLLHILFQMAEILQHSDGKGHLPFWWWHNNNEQPRLANTIQAINFLDDDDDDDVQPNNLKYNSSEYIE